MPIKQNMKFFLFRRLSVWVVTVFFISSAIPLVASAEQSQPTSIQQKLTELEVSSGGRLGISAINTANGMRIDYHAQERFPFCSTCKVIAISAILKESQKNPAILQKQITYSQKDVDQSGYAPVTKQHVSGGATRIVVRALASTDQCIKLTWK